MSSFCGAVIMSVERELTVEEVYYRLYPQEEDDMQGMLHVNLVMYLLDVLRWYYRFSPVTITYDLPYISGDVQAAADIAVVKGVRVPDTATVDSWRINPPERPAPVVAIEISSKTTWTIDVGEGTTDKPIRYGQLGLREYYAFDGAGHWQNSTVNLRAWRYLDGQPVERDPDEQGRFWSIELNCFLVPDGVFLRLYDSDGNRLPTKGEAGEQHAQREAHRAEHAEAKAEDAKLIAEKAEAKAAQEKAIAEQAKAVAERSAAEAEQAKLNAEQAEARAEQAKLNAEQAEARAEQETAEKIKAQAELEALLAKLKAKNIDLDAL
jgi:Putative restriction endonuclease